MKKLNVQTLLFLAPLLKPEVIERLKLCIIKSKNPEAYKQYNSTNMYIKPRDYSEYQNLLEDCNIFGNIKKVSVIHKRGIDNIFYLQYIKIDYIENDML